jgi:predicted secreted protein
MKVSLSSKLIVFASLCILTPIMAAPLMVSDLNKPIELSNNTHQFTIQLPRNATTGYMWVLDGACATSLITPIKQVYVETSKKLIGGGGHDYWTFNVNAQAYIVPTSIQLTFDYVRPWENGVAKSQIIKVIT